MQVAAIAYDNPIPGFQTNNTINLRLWAAKPGQEFDLEAFNTGDYVQVGARMVCHCHAHTQVDQKCIHMPLPFNDSANWTGRLRRRFCQGSAL